MKRAKTSIYEKKKEMVYGKLVGANGWHPLDLMLFMYVLSHAHWGLCLRQIGLGLRNVLRG